MGCPQLWPLETAKHRYTMLAARLRKHSRESQNITVNTDLAKTMKSAKQLRCSTMTRPSKRQNWADLEAHMEETIIIYHQCSVSNSSESRPLQYPRAGAIHHHSSRLNKLMPRGLESINSYSSMKQCRLSNAIFRQEESYKNMSGVCTQLAQKPHSAWKINTAATAATSMQILFHFATPWHFLNMFIIIHHSFKALQWNTREWFDIEGIVHPKMKIHSLPSHHYADGGVGEVFKSTKHLWSIRGKFCCSRIQYNWSQLWDFLWTS